MRQRRWIELLKNWDYTIEYHPHRANAVYDAHSRKAIGSLGYVKTIYYLLLAILRDMRVKLNVDYSKALLISFHVQPILIDWVKEAQCHDPKLMKIRSEIE